MLFVDSSCRLVYQLAIIGILYIPGKLYVLEIDLGPNTNAKR